MVSLIQTLNRPLVWDSAEMAPLFFQAAQSVSLNGRLDRQNDDRMGFRDDRAWVIDGATDLGPPGLFGSQGGASWLASAAGLQLCISSAPDVRSTCAQLFAGLADRFATEKRRDVLADWEVPKAAFALAQIVGSSLEVAWSADCSILHASATGVDWLTQPPDSTEEAKDALALGPGTGAASSLSGTALDDRRGHRMRPDHTALGPDPAASERATSYGTAPIAAGDDLLLMTDGFSSLVGDYARYTGSGLIEAVRQNGLTFLADELRSIEQEDSDCLRYPRFKASDDATAIWLKVAG